MSAGANAAPPPRACVITRDPLHDVVFWPNNGTFEDPTRDITSVRYTLTAQNLVFEVHLADLKELPSQSLGDLVGLQFKVDGQQDNFLIEASRRLVSTGTPQNSDYAKNYPDDDVKVLAGWDAVHDEVLLVVDLASASKHAKRPIRVGARLHDVAAITLPALTDNGAASLWADWAGRPGSNQYGVDLTRRRC